MIYFITQNDTFVKIGYTKHSANRRLISLQIGNPNLLTLVRLLPGNDKQEQTLHDRFVAYHVRGEWYYLSHIIASYIRDTDKQDVRYMDDRHQA